jgi:hypothetical protein
VYAEDVTSRTIEGLLGPRRLRTAQLHPYAVPYVPAQHHHYAPSIASVFTNNASLAGAVSMPEYVTTYMDDTRALRRDGQGTGGPELGRLLTPRYHGLTRAEVTTTDVSAAYGKARAAVG